jgi:hypothetical protein
MKAPLIILAIYYWIGFIFFAIFLIIDLKKNGLTIKEIPGYLAMLFIIPWIWILFVAIQIHEWWENIEDKKIF